MAELLKWVMGKYLVTFIYLNVKLVRTRDSPRKKFSENTKRGGWRSWKENNFFFLTCCGTRGFEFKQRSVWIIPSCPANYNIQK